MSGGPTSLFSHSSNDATQRENSSASFLSDTTAPCLNHPGLMHPRGSVGRTVGRSRVGNSTGLRLQRVVLARGVHQALPFVPIRSLMPSECTIQSPRHLARPIGSPAKSSRGSCITIRNLLRCRMTHEPWQSGYEHYCHVVHRRTALKLPLYLAAAAALTKVACRLR